MINKNKIKKILEKQGYRVVGENSSVKICNWTKKSLINDGVCYKEQFYGIKSHRCCQISCTLFNCQNKCLHCWRNLDYTEDIDLKNIDEPKEIIEGCINQQRKLLEGFKGNSKVNLKKLQEAQEPMQFAISLIGEATLYPKLGELISELRKQGKTSFLVTNGLSPEVLEKLNKNKQLPTQLYISLNSPNETLYNQWHNSKIKNAWKKFNRTLKLFPKLKTRKVIRMTLVKGVNSNMKDEFVEDYVKLIKKSKTDFAEIKGYMSVGEARKRKNMGYSDMPKYNEIKDFANKIANELKSEGYKILDEHEFSNVVLIGKDKGKMKIKKNEI
ncbi:MAG: 4-demethylwyosine synthase TYW1 [Nanoarchaeota archaeon]